MTFLDFQMAINKSWEEWKRARTEKQPQQIRKKKICKKCYDEGLLVKMDYLGNRTEKIATGVYDVAIYRCPRCGNIWKDYARTEKGLVGRQYGGR